MHTYTLTYNTRLTFTRPSLRSFIWFQKKKCLWACKTPVLLLSLCLVCLCFVSKGQLVHTWITQWRTSSLSCKLLLLTPIFTTRFFLWGLLSAVLLEAGSPSLALDGHVGWHRVVVILIVIKHCRPRCSGLMFANWHTYLRNRKLAS